MRAAHLKNQHDLLPEKKRNNEMSLEFSQHVIRAPWFGATHGQTAQWE